MTFEYQEPIRISLDTAIARYKVPIAGNTVEVFNASTVNATVTLTLLRQDGRKIENLPLVKTGKYVSPELLKEMWIDAPAQANEWVDIRVTHTSTPPQEPEYDPGVSNIISEIGVVSAVTNITNPVKITDGAIIGNNQVSVVATVRQLILAADPDRGAVSVRNIDAEQDIWLGGSTVDNTNGFPIYAGEAFSYNSPGALYGYSTSGSPKAAVFTVGD